MTKFKLAGAAALIAAATMSGAAIAGEITGNGTPIQVNGRSDCAFSGQNDTPLGDPPRDPGGRVQSYGYLVGHWGFINPQDWDPNGQDEQRIPGYACNPNRGHDLHAE